ncbi:sugar ABC transporter permease [Geobacillus stearothermophilus]|uniref:carbohydrate ABC transporter permease n=1 Tax=Geobacillus kaustophilus TaxID=1462 RepID=UPI000504024E|nr:carbohydrate ABC transporter permease [Geobacillus kaustophilus]KFL16749.1 sugar ABC transporter permease [Geobacillus stearothermophilus]KFX31772.1 sugar ABC transporter permease [Geobacillus stearothermophilus]KZM52256.1 sugar ABC transporter permease [Geobacillus stearothermophilus]
MAGSKTWKVGLLYVVAVAVLLVMVFPYLYMVLGSLAPWNEVDRKLIPSSLTLRSYEWLFQGGEDVVPRPWLRAFFNSLLVTSASTLLMLVTAVMVGYALSKVKFKGRQWVNNAILFQMFYPSIILLIPLFLIVRYFGWYNTYWAMIVPKAVNLWAIFMYTNFFRSIPDELIEAAKMDGAGHFTIIRRIVWPMSRSITTIIFLFLFMERWVELLWDMLVVNNEKMLTLNVLLAQMFGPYGGYPGPMYAASVLLTLPILILFLLFSKNFKEGMQFILK